MPWTHTSSSALQAWLTFLIPFTIYDSSYLLLRPHSLPDGKWHFPLYAPVYTYYATVDLMYSRANWKSGEGFAAAHCVMNMLECVFSVVYLWLLWRYGQSRLKIGGEAGRWAVLVGLINGSMTAHKTVLCVLYEYFGDYKNLGHNEWSTLLTSWIPTVCLYLSFSIYLVYICGRDILRELRIREHDVKAVSKPYKET